jgi:hypothetical protein
MKKMKNFFYAGCEMLKKNTDEIFFLLAISSMFVPSALSNANGLFDKKWIVKAYFDNKIFCQ